MRRHDASAVDTRPPRISWRSTAAIGALAALLSCTSDRSTAPRLIEPTTSAKQLGLSSAFDQFVFLPFTLDVQGANDQPAQSDLNGFTRADNVPGKLGVAWTWDDINSWTGTGQTGDACALFDTDVPANGKANYAICVRITNDPTGANVFQLSPGSPIIYSCGDGKTDRCSQPATPIALGSTSCEVVKTADLFPGLGDDGQDVLAACSIDLSAIGNATKTNILNVCSFPSGAPNSNAFDCIVTPGAAFLRIVKKTTPDASGKSFSFALSPAAADGQSTFSVTDNAAGDESTALIAVSPGNYNISETSIPSGWSLKAVSCVRGTTATGTKSGDAINGVGTSIGETTVCTFENIVGAPTVTVDKSASPSSIPETGGKVTYSVVVTNTALTAATLTALSDDKFGNLDKVGTCAIGQTIAASGSYSCSFDETLPAATAGATHKNTVTATLTNAGGTASNTDDAIVTYTDVAPTVSVTKTPNPTSVPESGGAVTYTVVVTNGSAESVTLTTLSDDKFGNLNGKGNCATGGSISAGATYTCAFSQTISGNAGTTHKNTVTATVTDDDNTPATNTADATVTFTNVLPTITVDKSANPTSVPETGGNVTYTVVVTNTSFEPVQLTTLSDNKFGNLNGKGTCATGGWIAAGGTYSCSFTMLISGEPGTHTNVVTATVTDNDNTTDTKTDDATVTITDVKPSITVTKTANPTSVPKTGGTVTYTVSVKNDVLESASLTTLSDDKFGNLDGQGTCDTPQTIAGGGTYTCTFTKTLSGSAGATHVNTVTATVTDNDGNSASGHDDATVTFTDVAPTLTVTKTASPTSVPETGGTVTFSVVVQNTSVESVTLTVLTDDNYGNLDGQGTCHTGGTITAGNSYSCSFSKTLSGSPGTTHKNIVTATVTDVDNTTGTATDDAVVTFTDTKPNISVTKTANPTSISTVASGTLTFTADRTFLSTPTPPNGFNFQSPTCDDAGANDQPAQVDLNCFNRADNVPNKLGVLWSWDDINSWTGTGQTGDACALIDTDNDGNANVAVCARISNNPDGSIFQVGGNGAADVYLCNDTKPDRCGKQVTQVLGAGKGSTTCTIAQAPEGFPGKGDDGADIAATCSIDLGMQGLAGTTSRDLLNVCSFPSGEPNSNPFDCVVTVGAAFVQIVKATNPASTQLFGFTLAAPSTDGTSKYAVQAGVSSGLIPVTPGTNYSITETNPTNWSLQSVSCAVDGVPTGTANVAQNKITGIVAKTGQTTVCTFSNTGLLTGPVSYTVSVTNLTLEAANLFSLNDDKFGNLNGVGTCATGGTILGGGTYTCSFTKTLTGAPGTTHTNTVTAVGKDDEGNSVTKTASATVSFVSPP